MIAARSIASRLFFSAIVWSLCLLVCTGVVIATLYRSSLDRSLDQRLNVYLRAIVADIAAGSDEARGEPGQLGEPQFQLPLSGLYWQITRLDSGQANIKSSRSLSASKLPRLADLGFEADALGVRSGNVVGPAGEKIHILERQIDVGDDGVFLIQIAAATEDSEYQFTTFVIYLAITLSVLGVCLVILSALQVRYGLRPLHVLQDEVRAIRRGESDHISGVFPEDMRPLASELNLMISFNREILERARTQVGNLAHALKTPLSVIVNEMTQDHSSSSDKVVEQVQIMRRQLSYYLDRARTAARYNVIGVSTEINPLIEGLVRTFEKIFRDKSLQFDIIMNENFLFRGERQDFEEMIGNLLDNAGKWAATAVVISVEAVPQSDLHDLNHYFIVHVEDDGPGLPPDLRNTALLRGGRLDETKPGSGLGLSIVQDLARLYGGSLELGQSARGGLRASVRLPRI
jgi:signal transduction histidine kinase